MLESNENLKLAARLVYSCEKAAPLRQKIAEFVATGNVEHLVEIKTLLEDTDPFLFYKVIALANHIANPFDGRVIRAYWFGNDLLKNVRYEHIRKIASTSASLENPLVPLMLLMGKKGFEKIILTHLLKLFYWFFFVKGDLVKKTKEEVENCRIIWGKAGILKKSDKARILNITYQPFNFDKNVVLNEKALSKEFSEILSPAINNGDIVACHRGDAIMVLRDNEISDLVQYTKLGLDYINKLKKEN